MTDRLIWGAGECSGVIEYRLVGELAVLPSSIIDKPVTLYTESALGGGEVNSSCKGAAPPADFGWVALVGGVARLALLINALRPMDTDDRLDLFLMTTVPLLGRGGGTS